MGDSERNLNNSMNDGSVKKHLQAMLADKIVRDYPVAKFIETVLGFTKDDLKKHGGEYTLNRALLVAYEAGRYDGPTSVERSAYAPLAELLEDLLTQVRLKMGKQDAGVRARLVNMLDRQMRGLFGNFKPDFNWSWLDNEAEQHWLLTALVGELKKDKSCSLPPRYSTRINLEALDKVRDCLAVLKCSMLLTVTLMATAAQYRNIQPRAVCSIVGVKAKSKSHDDDDAIVLRIYQT